jgi:hypothetical protein
MPMNARLLRPTASGIHPEAMDWRTRVLANGGSVDGATMSAVSQFCRRIDGSGLRGKFYRLNLFCGDGLTAALVPLYRAESSTATARGNATDTNNGPFVSGDYNNTGASSGLKGNGTSKFLNTGIAGNSLTAANTHFGVGLRAAESRAVSARIMGAFGGGSNAYDFFSQNDANISYSAVFTRFGTSTDFFGDSIGPANGPLAAGDIVAAWPSMYRNGAATGSSATTSQNYPNNRPLFVFALNNNGAGALHTNVRLNWYSIGLTMTAAEVLSFSNAIAAFNTALSRT